MKFRDNPKLTNYEKRKVIARMGPVEESGCRLWIMIHDKTRGDPLCLPPSKCGEYRSVNVAGTTWPAHRIVYLIFKGPIPPGYVIDHICRMKSCVAPEHLEAVLPAENVRREVPRRLSDSRVAIGLGAVGPDLLVEPGA